MHQAFSKGEAYPEVVRCCFHRIYDVTHRSMLNPLRVSFLILWGNSTYSKGVQHRKVGHYVVSFNRLPEQPHSEGYCPVLIKSGRQNERQMHGALQKGEAYPEVVWCCFHNIFAVFKYQRQLARVELTTSRNCSLRYAAVPAIRLFRQSIKTNIMT